MCTILLDYLLWYNLIRLLIAWYYCISLQSLFITFRYIIFIKSFTEVEKVQQIIPFYSHLLLKIRIGMCYTLQNSISTKMFSYIWKLSFPKEKLGIQVKILVALNWICNHNSGTKIQLKFQKKASIQITFSWKFLYKLLHSIWKKDRSSLCCENSNTSEPYRFFFYKTYTSLMLLRHTELKYGTSKNSPREFVVNSKCDI